MNPLLLIVGLAAAVWLAVILVRGGTFAGCLLVLLAASCFGHPFYNADVGPLPLTADRILLAILVVQYLLFRQLGLADPKPWSKAEGVMCAFLATLAASTFLHDWQAGGYLPVARLVFFYGMPAALYLVARQSRLGDRQAWWLLACLGLFGVYLGVTALAEVHQASWAVFPRYITSPAFAEFFGRARGPFLNPIGCGMFLTMGLCAALLVWSRMPRVARPIWLSAMAVMVAGVYYTLTRSVWGGAGLAVLLVASLTVPRGWRGLVLGGAVLAGCLLVAAKWDRIWSFQRDKNVSESQMAESASLRPILAAVAWKMFCDRPLFGCGFGQYHRHHAAYLADRSIDLPLEKARPYVQHNVFLALLTETGLMGAGLFAVLLGAWGRAAWKLWRDDAAPEGSRRTALLFLAFLAAYLPSALVHDLFLIPAVNMLMFFVAGITTGLAAAWKRERAARPAPYFA